MNGSLGVTAVLPMISGAHYFFWLADPQRIKFFAPSRHSLVRMTDQRSV